MAASATIGERRRCCAALVPGAVLFTRYPLPVPVPRSPFPFVLVSLLPFSFSSRCASCSLPVVRRPRRSRVEVSLTFPLPFSLSLYISSPSHPSPWPRPPILPPASPRQHETPPPIGKTTFRPSSITQRTALQTSYGSSSQKAKKRRKRSGVTKVGRPLCPSFLPPTPPCFLQPRSLPIHLDMEHTPPPADDCGVCLDIFPFYPSSPSIDPNHLFANTLTVSQLWSTLAPRRRFRPATFLSSPLLRPLPSPTPPLLLAPSLPSPHFP